MSEPSTEPREPSLELQALSELCQERAHTDPLYAVAAAILAHAEAVSGGLDQVTAALITVAEKISEHGTDTAPLDHGTELSEIATALEGIAHAMPESNDTGNVALAIRGKPPYDGEEVSLVNAICQLANAIGDKE